MKFLIKSARVAHRLAACTSPPKRGLGSVAIGADSSNSSCLSQSLFWLNEGAVVSVDLVIESASVAQIVSVSISSPQWSGRGCTVHTFSSLVIGSTPFNWWLLLLKHW